MRCFLHLIAVIGAKMMLILRASTQDGPLLTESTAHLLLHPCMADTDFLIVYQQL